MTGQIKVNTCYELLNIFLVDCGSITIDLILLVAMYAESDSNLLMLLC